MAEPLSCNANRLLRLLIVLLETVDTLFRTLYCTWYRITTRAGPSKAAGSNPPPPKVIGVVVAEPKAADISLRTVASIAAWCMAYTDVQQVHLYDASGHMKRCKDMLEDNLSSAAIQEGRSVVIKCGWSVAKPTGLTAEGINSNSSNISRSVGAECTSNSSSSSKAVVTVRLLSAEDAYMPVINAALERCAGYAPGSSPIASNAEVGQQQQWQQQQRQLQESKQDHQQQQQQMQQAEQHNQQQQQQQQQPTVSSIAVDSSAGSSKCVDNLGSRCYCLPHNSSSSSSCHHCCCSGEGRDAAAKVPCDILNQHIRTCSCSCSSTGGNACSKASSCCCQCLAADSMIRSTLGTLMEASLAPGAAGDAAAAEEQRHLCGSRHAPQQQHQKQQQTQMQDHLPKLQLKQDARQQQRQQQQQGSMLPELSALCGADIQQEPQLLLVYGPVLTLAGYPAYHTRACEVQHMGCLVGASRQRVAAAIAGYCKVLQRHGA